MAIYTFEGPNELYVHASLEAAEGYFEAIDVENKEYVFFGSDGTLVQPSVRDGQVNLSPTGQGHAEELANDFASILPSRALRSIPHWPTTPSHSRPSCSTASEPVLDQVGSGVYSV